MVLITNLLSHSCCADYIYAQYSVTLTTSDILFSF